MVHEQGLVVMSWRLEMLEYAEAMLLRQCSNRPHDPDYHVEPLLLFMAMGCVARAGRI